MDQFFDPGSVAVLEASNDPAKWGFWLAAGALRGAGRRSVFLINSRAASIQGEPIHAGLDELPEVPDLLVISIPGPAVPGFVHEALEAGVRAFLIRVPQPEALAATIVAAGARLIDPNSLVDDDATAQVVLYLVFTASWLPAAHRIAVISDSGGQGAIAADMAEKYRLCVDVFDPSTAAAVAAHLPEAGHIDNPIDLDGAGEQDLSVYSDLVRVLLDDERIDAVVVSGYFGCYGEDIPELLDAELAEVERLGRIVAEYRKPLIVHSMSATSSAVARLWETQIPSYTSMEAAMRVIAGAGFYSSHAGRIREALELTGPVTPWGTGYSAARDTITAAGVAVSGTFSQRWTRARTSSRASSVLGRTRTSGRSSWSQPAAPKPSSTATPGSNSLPSPGPRPST